MKKNKIKIGVVGLGYVGLPLCIEFNKVYSTLGYDKDKKRVEELKQGFDKTKEISSKDLLNSKVIFSYDSKILADCNVYIITVPTPIKEDKKPDLAPLGSASRLIGKYLKKGDIVIYESTVYPGATEEYCVPIIEKTSNLTFNKDFFCGYSPERINPGDKKHTLTKIIKVTSGSNKTTADFVDNLYRRIITAGTHKASSIMVAEAAKVIENTQRDVNIALMNELSIIFNRLNLDTKEVLEVAGTKWNFLPFRPGLVGGHCIGVDPYYLTYKSEKVGYYPQIILAGRSINDNMDKYIIENLKVLLAKNGKDINQVKIGILGLTFKENCPDLRNSKVFNIINRLKLYKCKIVVADYFADCKEAKEKYNINIQDLSEIKNSNVILLAVGHEEYASFSNQMWTKLLEKKGILIDIKSLYDIKFFDKTDIIHWRL